MVTVEVEQIRSNIKEEAIISFDGREGSCLFPGDQVKIYKSQEVTPFIKATEVSFCTDFKGEAFIKRSGDKNEGKTTGKNTGDYPDK